MLALQRARGHFFPPAGTAGFRDPPPRGWGAGLRLAAEAPPRRSAPRFFPFVSGRGFLDLRSLVLRTSFSALWVLSTKAAVHDSLQPKTSSGPAIKSSELITRCFLGGRGPRLPRRVFPKVFLFFPEKISKGFRTGAQNATGHHPHK